jgi:hypothetical protein
MKVAKHLYWRLNVLDDSWLNSKDVDTLSCKFDDVFSFYWELGSLLGKSEVFRLDQTSHEKLAEVFIGILKDIYLVLESWPKFLRLLLKLVDGNLSHKH